MKIGKKTIVTSSVICVVLLGGVASAAVLLPQKQKSSVQFEKVETKVSEEVKTDGNQDVEAIATPSASPTPSASAQAQPSPSAEPKSSNPYASNTVMSYLYDKRAAVNKPVGKWGWTSSWAALARQEGIVVNRAPQIYDIAVSGSEGYFVEAVNPDGSITASTRNSLGNVVSRTIPSGQVTAYQYIH